MCSAETNRPTHPRLRKILALNILAKESERRTTVTVENGQLFMERTDGKKTELLPEVTGLFFRKGVEGRILFHFGSDGKVDGLIDHRNNEDVVWRKAA